jgi:hypothetical protein
MRPILGVWFIGESGKELKFLLHLSNVFLWVERDRGAMGARGAVEEVAQCIEHDGE